MAASVGAGDAAQAGTVGGSERVAAYGTAVPAGHEGKSQKHKTRCVVLQELPVQDWQHPLLSVFPQGEARFQCHKIWLPGELFLLWSTAVSPCAALMQASLPSAGAAGYPLCSQHPRLSAAVALVLP